MWRQDSMLKANRRDAMGRALRWAAAGAFSAGGSLVAHAGARGQTPDLVPAGGLEVVDDSGASVMLSAERLAALPQRVTLTHTAWTDGVRRFEGPLLSDVMAAAGMAVKPDSLVQARALNDYLIEIPAADFRRWPVILAWSMDGKVLTRRDKGPFWIVYPRDDDRTLSDARYDHRWAWQLRRLTLRPAAR